MKKKGMRILALALVAAMLSGCGKDAKDSKSEEKDSAKTEAKTESNSGLDDSEGRYVGKSSKWDGCFVDNYGIKVRPGMTINEIVEQGCVVSPDYFDDINEVIDAPTNMCINTDYKSGDNSILYIYVENENGNYDESSFSKDVWFVNPYPYAVPFGECVVSSMLPHTGDMGVEWNTDEDDSMSIDELKALFDIAPYIDKYDNYDYPYEDYFVQFDITDDRVSMIEAFIYGHDDNYKVPECLSFAGEDYKDWDKTTEKLDTNVDSYTFKMGFGTHTIDLSYFESIEEMSRTYLPESDYTKSLYIKGVNTNGETVVIELSDTKWDYYFNAVGNMGHGSTIKAEELPNGEIHNSEGNTASQNIDTIDNKSILLEVSVDTGDKPDVNHTMEVYHTVEGIISTSAE